MKKFFTILFFLLLAIVTTVEAKTTSVKGYRRKNGTYVRSYTRNTSSSSYRSRSSSSYRNNYYNYRLYNSSARDFSKSMKQKQYLQQGGRCRHCGKYGSMSDMHADHIIPYSKGGRTTASNLQILCRDCNLKKSNRYSH